MANERTGTVIVFKDGVSVDEAAHALSTIKNFIDFRMSTIDTGNEWSNLQRMIREFDPEWGGPTWYIP